MSRLPSSLCVLCVLVLSACTGTPAEHHTVALRDGWSYRWGDPARLPEDGLDASAPFFADSSWRPTSSLQSPPGRGTSDVLWLRLVLPDTLPPDPLLLVSGMAFDYAAFAGGRLLRQEGNFRTDASDRFMLTNPQLITLPEGTAADTLYLRVYSGSRLIGLFGAPWLTSRTTVYRDVFRAQIDAVILSLIYLLVGLLSLLFALKVRSGLQARMALYLSLLSASAGLSYVGGSLLFYLLFDVPALWYFLSGTFFFFPVGLLGFHREVLRDRSNRVVRWMMGVHLAFGVAAFAVDLFGWEMAPNLNPLFFSLLLVSLLALVVDLIPALRTRKYSVRLFALGMTVALVLGLHDTILLGLQILPNEPQLSRWGILFLFLCLGAILEHQYAENARALRRNAEALEAQSAALQRANARLEEVNRSLEQRVAERTRDLREKNDTLTRTLTELKDTQTQLIQQEKMASLGRLTAGIAHEIKNPLNFVNNFAELNVEFADELANELANELAGVDREDVRALLDDLRLNSQRITEHGRRADRIVRSMLAHSRGALGEKKPTAFNALVEEYVALAYHGMRAQHPDFNVTLEPLYDVDAGTLPLVPQEIGRVVLNLVDNAFDAVYERARTIGADYTPTVRIQTKRTGDAVLLRIEDNGTGIPERLREKVFEPFFTTKPTGEGTGLGLSLSYEIVTRRHSGTMTLEDTPVDGTAFVVTLPA